MKYKVGLALTPLAFAIAPAAIAQTSEGYQSPFSVRAGGAYLTDGNARSALGNFGWIFGVGYDLPFHGVISKIGEASIDFDYQGWSRSGAQAQEFSLQYVERVPFSPMDSSGTQGYWGLGVGGYYDHVNGSSGGGSSVGTLAAPQTFGGGSGGRGSLSRTQIGGEILLGVRFQKNIFLEAAYHIQPDVNSVSPNTLTLSVGYHF